MNPGATPEVDDDAAEQLPLDMVDFGDGLVLEKGEFSDTVAAIIKTHGNTVVSSGTTIRTFKHIRTGIFTLDFALGGGIPEGLCTMIYGWASSGKTTITLRIIAQALKKYPRHKAVFVDVEGTFDPEWAEIHGIDMARLILITPSSGEQAADIAISAVKALDICIVAVDSVAMLTPMKEMDKSIEDPTVAGASQLIARFLRKISQTMIDERSRGHWPTLVLLNQWRTKIGVTHGDPRVLPGGNILTYAAAVKIEMKNKEISSKTENISQVVEHNEHAFTIHKNKVINGPRQGEFLMVRSPSNPLGVGYIDEMKTVVTVARNFGLVTGGGTKWRLEGVEEAFPNLMGIYNFLVENEETVGEPLRIKLIKLQRGRMGKLMEGWE